MVANLKRPVAKNRKVEVEVEVDDDDDDKTIQYYTVLPDLTQYSI